MTVQDFFDAAATPVIFVTVSLFAGLMTSGALFDNLRTYSEKYSKKLRDNKKNKNVLWISRFSWRARSIWWLPLFLVGANALWQGFACFWTWHDDLPVTSGKVSAVFAIIIANTLIVPFAALGFFVVALGNASNVAMTLLFPAIVEWGCVIALFFLSHPLDACLQIVSGIIITVLLLWIRGTEYARSIKNRPIIERTGEVCVRQRVTKASCDK